MPQDTKKQRLIFLVNMSQLIRTEILNEREFLVIPTVMARCDFVMNECLYTKACFEDSLILWNGRPVVLSHPFKGGKPILAASPEVFAAQAVGTIYHARIEDDRLKCDIYLDKGKTEAMTLGKILLELLQNNIDLDVSTGMLVGEEIESTGEKDGRHYTHIINKIIPDHLAILISEPGAATQADGVGIPRINRLAINAQDFDQISSNLSTALGENWWNEPAEFPRRRLDSVYPEYIIYREQSGKDDPVRYFKRAYLVDASAVVLDDIFMEVVQEWVPAQPVNQQERKEEIMNKKLEVLVNSGVITKEQAEALDKGGEVVINTFCATQEKLVANEAQVTELKKAADTAKTENADLKVQVNAAGERVAVLEQKEAEREAAQKAELIPTILTNAEGVYTEDELKAMPLPSLQKIHRMATNAKKTEAPAKQEPEQPNFYMPPLRTNAQEVETALKDIDC